MEDASAFAPIPRHRLSDQLVARILASIASGELRSGDRLPPIIEMARNFGVAAATLREALTRLEERRAITVRHGSGVFVASACGLVPTDAVSGRPPTPPRRGIAASRTK